LDSGPSTIGSSKKTPLRYGLAPILTTQKLRFKKLISSARKAGLSLCAAPNAGRQGNPNRLNGRNSTKLLNLLGLSWLTANFGRAYSCNKTSGRKVQSKGRGVAKKQDRKEERIVGFLGVGLDNTDEHKRITRSEHFLLVGGSKDTHERMQDTAIRFSEKLRQRGKSLQETPVDEVIEIFHEAKE
jgi:hypothetical protein